MQNFIEDLEPSVRIEDRMQLLARRMLGQFPGVRRWEETDDILQEAALRLHRALQCVRPQSELHWHRLRALLLRRVLLDLARRYSGRYSFAANHETGFEAVVDQAAERETCVCENDPAGLESWTRFHTAAGELSTERRDAFDLLWYQGLSQEEAARLLGVTKRTLQRWWRGARLELMQTLDGEFPE